MVVYAGFSVYLYRPHFEGFRWMDYLYVLNSVAGAAGCFVLSRRWIAGFWGSFFAGAIYGFGPFLLGLGLGKYHPAAGFLAASVPWLLWPAAAAGRSRKWGWSAWPLSVLPFLAVVVFFQLCESMRFFPMSAQARLHLSDLGGLAAPLAAARRGVGSVNLVGFYHVPIAPFVVGVCMLVAARRMSVIAICVAGTVLACSKSILGISPIIWLSFPVVCCSVLVGVGLEGLSSAGVGDRRWVLATGVVTGVLTVAALLLATKYFQVFAGLGNGYGKVFMRTAQMYITATLATAIIFFLARAKVRMHWVRLAILASAMAVDIFFGAVFIVDAVY